MNDKAKKKARQAELERALFKVYDEENRSCSFGYFLQVKDTMGDFDAGQLLALYEGE